VGRRLYPAPGQIRQRLADTYFLVPGDCFGYYQNIIRNIQGRPHHNIIASQHLRCQLFRHCPFLSHCRFLLACRCDLHEVPSVVMNQQDLLSRITCDPQLFGGKPVIRGRRLAIEHVLAQLAAGDTAETLLDGYPWLEPADIQACLAYAQNVLSHEKFVPLEIPAAA